MLPSSVRENNEVEEAEKEEEEEEEEEEEGQNADEHRYAPLENEGNNISLLYF